MTKRNEIIAACKAIEPNPEHGPSQYGVVITYLRDDEGVDFSKMTTKDAVSAVLGHMNISQRSSAAAKAKKVRKYFTLVSRGPDDTRWAIEFGDYDRNVVKQERDDLKDGDQCDHAFRILETGAKQADIDAAVAELNAVIVPKMSGEVRRNLAKLERRVAR